MYAFEQPQTDTHAYYIDGLVDISDGWASFSGKHFKVSDITRVRIVGLDADITVLWSVCYGVVLVIIAVIAVMLEPGLSFASVSNTFEGGGYSSYSYTPFLGLECLVFGFMLISWFLFTIFTWHWRTSDKLHILQLSGEFGKANVLVSVHRGYLRIIERALRRAIRDVSESQ